MPDRIRIGDEEVKPGQRRRLDVALGMLPAGTPFSVALEVVNGIADGPVLWLGGGLRGDELIGAEVIREILQTLDPGRLAGAVVAAPVVNVLGLLNRTAAMPDGRDLSRSFPGSAGGSLTGQVAGRLMALARRCTHGVEFRAGHASHAALPLLRGDLRHDETRRCANAFAPPVLLPAQTRDGSLRAAASRLGGVWLQFEAGQPLRLDAGALACGVDGTRRLMTELRMLPAAGETQTLPVREVLRAVWVHARRGGLFRLDATLGQEVKSLQRLGTLSDLFGENAVAITAPTAGIVMAHTMQPLANHGDPLVQIAVESREIESPSP